MKPCGEYSPEIQKDSGSPPRSHTRMNSMRWIRSFIHDPIGFSDGYDAATQMPGTVSDRKSWNIRSRDSESTVRPASALSSSSSDVLITVCRCENFSTSCRSTVDSEFGSPLSSVVSDVFPASSRESTSGRDSTISAAFRFTSSSGETPPDLPLTRGCTIRIVRISSIDSCSW